MQAEDWRQRWRDGRIGFHHDAPMPLLTGHWSALDVAPGSRVLVPLCGKSLDMPWLRRQGLRVLGVELSSLAIEQFLDENGLTARRHEAADGIHHVTENIELIQGDVLDLDDATLAGCDAIYDRAAVIALPPDMRREYARRVYARLPAHCRGLMITLEYPQHEMNGPPFSVDDAEVARLLGDAWHIETLERRDILDNQPGFQKQGLSSLHTSVYRLRHRPETRSPDRS